MHPLCFRPRQFFSLLLNRTLRFEGRHEIWSPLYPTDLHFSKLIGACRIDELDLALKHSPEGTKWPKKHVLHHKCIVKVQDFFLSRYSGFSLYFSCALPWWSRMGRAVVTMDGKSFGSRIERGMWWIFASYWTLIIKQDNKTMPGFSEWHVKLALQVGDMLDGVMLTKISLGSSFDECI